MEKQACGKKTAILCALCLAVIAAASFCSMRYFTRTVFGNIGDWQLCFGVLAACLLVSAAIKKPPVSLALCVAAAAAMYFITPFYPALFFPVSLQAALWEAAQSDTKTGRATFALSLLSAPACIPCFFRLREYLTYNAATYFESDPRGEAYACFAGLVLLLILWTALLCGSLRRKKKTPAKKSGRKKGKTTDGRRAAAVYALGAVCAVLSGVSCTQLFIGEYVKLLFFADGLFAFYLLYRHDPLLCGALRLNAEGAEQHQKRG